MQTLFKTHKTNRTYHGNHFFVLSKGNNAGRPMDKPCPNCFVIITKCTKEKQLLYWLFAGLWQCGYFRPYLSGSVIPFLRLPELKSIIREARSKVGSYSDYTKTVETLDRLENLQRAIVKQLQLITQIKKKVFRKLVI